MEIEIRLQKGEGGDILWWWSILCGFFFFFFFLYEGRGEREMVGGEG